MEMAITYTNNRGESITFGGDEKALNLFENSLRDAEWDYEVSGGSTTYFSRPKAEIDLPVGVRADTEEEGLAWRDRLADITEADVIDNAPGTVSVNGWELPCYVIGREADNWWMDGRFFECELTLLALSRVWSLSHPYRIGAYESADGGDGLDLSFDYPHDYHVPSGENRTVENPGVGAADLVLRFYGACSNPFAVIGGNTYGAKVTVKAGAYLEIDTERKRCVLVGSYGDEKDVFASRYAGAEGSGSYVFEKLPCGVQAVSVDRGIAMDVVVVEHRSEPRWVSERAGQEEQAEPDAAEEEEAGEDGALEGSE